MGLSLHGCFPVKPWHSLVVKSGSSLYVMKMGSWQPTSGFVPHLKPPNRSRLLPDKVTHLPLAFVRWWYNRPTLLSHSGGFFYDVIKFKSVFKLG